MLHVSALFEPSSGIHFKKYCFFFGFVLQFLSYCIGGPFCITNHNYCLYRVEYYVYCAVQTQSEHVSNWPHKYYIHTVIYCVAGWTSTKHVEPNRYKKYGSLLIKKFRNFMFNYSIFPRKNRTVYQIIWKNITERGRPQMNVWRIRIARWIPNATNTHTEYVIRIPVTTVTMVARTHLNITFIIIIIIIIIIILLFIYCNWVVTRWQWLFYM